MLLLSRRDSIEVFPTNPHDDIHATFRATIRSANWTGGGILLQQLFEMHPSFGKNSKKLGESMAVQRNEDQVRL